MDKLEQQLSESHLRIFYLKVENTSERENKQGGKMNVPGDDFGKKTMQNI
jgi:hypothetical protein